MEASAALKSYAEEKSARLARYVVEPSEVHWVLSGEKIRHIAEVTVVAKNLTVKAAESTQDLYSAIDMALEKLERQLRRHKEKVKKHKFAPTEVASVRYQTVAVEAGSRGPRVIKTENLFVKPMSLEEAALQLDMNKSGFLVYTDAETSNVNVLYRRDDGNLGLIETRIR
jgi:putative sigma-54 modulation protein